MSEEANSQQVNSEQQHFAIHKIYLKDVSFETPNSPSLFSVDWQPEINLNLNTTVNKLETGFFEVVLIITVTAKQKDKTGFLVEVHQAGIFEINGFEATSLKPLLSSYCPATLFPYAREAISDLVTKGGFPPLLLAPINFDALLEDQIANDSATATNS